MRDTDSLFEFYKGKKIILTGHTGFKGTWMSTMLEILGAEVCGYSLPINKNSFYGKVSPNIQKHVEGDIADEKKVLYTISSFQPEIVFHFASHSSLDGSMKIPDFILRTNLMGVVNVLEAVRNLDSVKSMVVVTSDKCYENMETDNPYTEDAPLGAKDPYSTSKVCQELLASCYMETFFSGEEKKLGIATARASNVIGPGDYNISRLMPYLLDSFMNNRIPKIRNPYAVRPWQYVLDVLYGYLLLAEKLFNASGKTSKFNGAYNFGPGEDGFERVGRVAELVGKCFQNPFYLETRKNGQISKETKVLKLDSSKAKRVLVWENQMKLKEAIELTADFVKLEKNGQDTGELCRKYILEYFSL